MSKISKTNTFKENVVVIHVYLDAFRKSTIEKTKTQFDKKSDDASCVLYTTANGINLKLGDFEELSYGAWLGTFIVDAWITELIAGYPMRKARLYEYPFVDPFDPKRFQENMGKAKRIESYRYMFFTVCHARHWHLLVLMNLENIWKEDLPSQ
jgi:hypothetical protein